MAYEYSCSVAFENRGQLASLDLQGGLSSTWSRLLVPAPKKNPEINRESVAKHASSLKGKRTGIFWALTAERIFKHGPLSVM